MGSLPAHIKAFSDIRSLPPANCRRQTNANMRFISILIATIPSLLCPGTTTAVNAAALASKDCRSVGRRQDLELVQQQGDIVRQKCPPPPPSPPPPSSFDPPTSTVAPAPDQQAMSTPTPTFAASQSSSRRRLSIIARSGTRLMENGAPFRFASYNTPNLHNLEDRSDGPTPPTEFEQRDALRTIAQLGGRVTRTYVLSLASSSDTSPYRYISGRGDGQGTWTLIPGGGGNIWANDDMFKVLDRALAIANEYGVRLIIPFIDRWDWWGGINTFSTYYGKPDATNFYTDGPIRDGFKALIAYVLNRVNTITGVAYKDDGAIAMWETGNELMTLDGGMVPAEWTCDIAKYIKSIDSRHLVMDGAYGLPGFQKQVLEDPNIDVISNHYYWNSAPPDRVPPFQTGSSFATRMQIDADYIKGFGKAFVVGEFGLVGFDWYTELVNAVVADPDVAGIMVWSLRYHARDGGFYWHNEQDQYWAYHNRGFNYTSAEPGFPKDDQSVWSLFRNATAALNTPTTRYLTEAPHPPPQILTSTSNRAGLQWTGSTGATSYTVERASSKNGPFSVVGAGVMDNVEYGRAIWKDSDATNGEGAWYRVYGINEYGKSDCGDVVQLF